MVRTVISFIILSLILTLFNCSNRKPLNSPFINENKQKNESQKSEKIYDTLSIGLNECAELKDSFFVFHHLAIPVYFNLKDTASVRIKDVIHCFIVLEPLDIINSDFHCIEDNRRILLHILKYKDKITYSSYKNLITNSNFVSNQFNHIVVENEELIINHQFGNRFNWNYTMCLKIQQQKIVLSKIIVDCNSPNHKKENIIYYYSNLMPDLINFDDTLINNCGCDRFWK
jgi:hypothetical protein